VAVFRLAHSAQNVRTAQATVVEMPAAKPSRARATAPAAKPAARKVRATAAANSADGDWQEF